jgi:hypothetical protein
VPAILIGFDILKSNWPLGHYSFPIFFANALSWLGSESVTDSGARLRTGESVVERPLRDGGSVDWAGVRFRTPSGRLLVPSRERGDVLVLASADEAGIYEVVGGDRVLSSIPVGLLNHAESSLEPAKEVDFGDFTLEVKAAAAEGARDLWKWIALGALALLVLEWCVYQRRLLV